MAGHTPWKEIRRKKHERIARQAVEWWLKDCIATGRSTGDGIPDLNTNQTKQLLGQIQQAIQIAKESVQKLAAAQKEYIEFLEEGLREPAMFAAHHGMEPSIKDIEKGDRLRVKLAALRTDTEVGDTFKRLARETVKDSREILDALESKWDSVDVEPARYIWAVEHRMLYFYDSWRILSTFLSYEEACEDVKHHDQFRSKSCEYRVMLYTPEDENDKQEGEEMNETKTIVDIVDRLRLMNQPEADEAATEIERLREENKDNGRYMEQLTDENIRLQDALGKIAAMIRGLDKIARGAIPGGDDGCCDG